MKKILFFEFVLLFVVLVGGFFFIQHRTNVSIPKVPLQVTTPPHSSTTPAYPDLSIDSIFDNHLIIPENSITLIATGDVIPARVVNINAIRYNTFLWPWEKTADFTKNADITLIDLETPIFDGCPQTNTGFTFCGEDEHIQGLLAGGVDAASIANNHSGNYGKMGLDKTIQLLEQNNIVTHGYEKIGYMTVKGTRFAFLGYNDIGALYLDKQKMVQAIQSARQQADVVVVSYHWGTEYKTQPDLRQIDIAHLAIDSGADLIIGNHPHWIQPVELYKGKYIMYAHGNFIFDQMWSEETKIGVVGKYVFVGNKLIDVEYYPTYIQDYGQPFFLEGERKQKVLNELQQASKVLQASM